MARHAQTGPLAKPCCGPLSTPGMLAWGWLLSLVAAPAHAQRMDSFEGGSVRWQLVDSDCQAQLATHEMTFTLPHGGSASEAFDVVCSQGTMALLAYPIEPSRVLDEFRPALWVRSSSGRIQLGVRVIFPLAEHPVTAGRLSSVLWGEMYVETGQWQMLQVTELDRKLNLEIVGLRQRFGADLNLEGAYIDCLVLNAYTGPGSCRVQVDDLNLRGLVSMAATGQPPPPNWREKWRWRYEVQQGPEQRFWAGGNRPATWLHYQQESLAWIKSLGFTGVVLSELPSQQLLTRIADAELATIAPAPPHSIHFDAESAAAIKGWSIGAALDARQAEAVRTVAARTAQLPEALQRPMFAEALEHYWQFSRIADEVIVPLPIPATAGTAIDKLNWGARQLETTRKRGAGWVSLAVGPTPALADQVRAAHTLIEPDSPFDEVQANPLGLRYQAASGVLAGARGFVFHPFRPLEPLGLSGPGASVQLAALRWIHRDLSLWGPWIVGGEVISAPITDRPDFAAKAWGVAQSRLVLAVVTDDRAQQCLPSTSDRPLRLNLAGPSWLQQVFRLSNGRLERVEVESTAAGLSWRVEEPQPIESFLVTTNPLVIEFARNQLVQQADQQAADRLEVVAYNLGLAEHIMAARFPALEVAPGNRPGSGPAGPYSQRLASARRLVDQGYAHLRSRQWSQALLRSSQASQLVQGLLFETYVAATANLAEPQSSPLVLNPSTLSYHWRLAEACARSQWQNLPIPGLALTHPGELESLGWSLEQRELQQAEVQVELLPAQDTQPSGIRFAAYARQAVSTATRHTNPEASDPQAFEPELRSTSREAIPGGYEGASSRVRTAAAQVKRGQLVRVAARARILRAPTTPDSGLLVYDNQAGPSLGQLVRGATGELVPVELYRFAVADGEFRILAECRGECDIVLEEIAASVIEPAVNRRSYETSSPQ